MFGRAFCVARNFAAFTPLLLAPHPQGEWSGKVAEAQASGERQVAAAQAAVAARDQTIAQLQAAVEERDGSISSLNQAVEALEAGKAELARQVGAAPAVLAVHAVLALPLGARWPPDGAAG